jgi:hypothetical protein
MFDSRIQRIRSSYSGLLFARSETEIEEASINKSPSVANCFRRIFTARLSSGKGVVIARPRLGGRAEARSKLVRPRRLAGNHAMKRLINSSARMGRCRIDQSSGGAAMDPMKPSSTASFHQARFRSTFDTSHQRFRRPVCYLFVNAQPLVLKPRSRTENQCFSKRREGSSYQ